jgi:hypothetical protein
VATPEDIALIERLLRKNRKLAEKWAAFEDTAAAQLAPIFRDFEVGKRGLLLKHLVGLDVDDVGRILNNDANTGHILQMLRDVGGYNDEFLRPGSPFVKWVNKNMDRSAVLGIRKALDTVRIADASRLPAKGWQAERAMSQAAGTKEMLFEKMHGRGAMDLDILRDRFMDHMLDPQGTVDTLRTDLVNTGQIEGMLDSAGRRVTADVRADRIANYELAELKHKAQDEALAEFYYDGEMPALDEQFRLWDATGDTRTRESHMRRHQKILTIEEWQSHSWGDGRYGLPKTDPGCRCDDIFVDPEWFSPETRERHFTNRMRVDPLEEERVAA